MPPAAVERDVQIRIVVPNDSDHVVRGAIQSAPVDGEVGERAVYGEGEQLLAAPADGPGIAQLRDGRGFGR